MAIKLPKEGPQQDERYTYADYCTWGDDERWELIDGAPYAMSPAPTWTHQAVSSNLHGQLFNFLKGKPYKVFAAPFDIRLNADTADDTVVQPDLVIVCDKSKLEDKGGCKGAPDMVVEILSPSTARCDKTKKFRLYQKSGIREYWIVDPDSRTVSVHVLENGKYTVANYDDDDGAAPVNVLPGCEINLQDVFTL